ncbi:hypothetical protein ACQJBY_047206 [Aegilops geniculata]
MEHSKGVRVHIVSHSSDTDWSVPPPPSRLLQMLGAADGKWLCLIVATFTLASSFFNFQVSLLGDDGLISKENYSEWVTGVLEVVVCGAYVVLKLLEFVYNLLARQLKSRITCRPTGHQPFLWSYQPFIDTAILVVISYLILLDINWSFVWLAIFPVTAIVFILALYLLKFNSSTRAYSKVIEETNRETMEFETIAMTLMALLFMDLLPPEYAPAGFSISQFLLFLSCTMASLTRMMMKLPTSASPGVAPASEMLHKTLLVLLLVTAHTVAAEWLGVDVVLLCLPEVIPVLLCFLLHIHRKPGSSSITSGDKMKARINWLGMVGALVVAPLFAHLLLTMDESGLYGWCTTFQVSSGVSGALTCYLVFMLNHWTRQQVAAAGEEDGASGMLMLWACALLIAWAVSLLLWYLVSLRLGLPLPLHATTMYVGNLFGFNYSN